MPCEAWKSRHNGKPVGSFEVVWRMPIQSYLADKVCSVDPENGDAWAVMAQQQDELFEHARKIAGFQPGQKAFERVLNSFMGHVSSMSSDNPLSTTRSGYMV